MSFFRPLGCAAAILVAVGCHDSSAPDATSIRQVSRQARAIGAETFFGPEQFVRGRGAPQSFSRTISTDGYEAPFVLHVRNGDASGANRVSSASVWMAGTELLSERDFNQNAAGWSIPVTPGASTSIEVSVAGTPGGYLEISLEGVPVGTQFCPGSAAAFGDLRAAVEATEPGGTILVCDGEHVIDHVVIDRPLTLRARHAGMATLRDAVALRPALVIDGVTDGLVRISGLRFLVSGTAIHLGRTFSNEFGAWDRVEVDSAWFVGAGTNARPIRPQASTVATARLDVTNSAFENVVIGVFPTGGEVNVRNSTFDRSGSGVTYSFNGVTRASFGTTENNVFRGCGISGCIRSLGGGGITVRNNHIESAETGVALNPFLNSGVITVQMNAAASPGTVTIEGNTIVGRRKTEMPADEVTGYVDAIGIVVGAQRPYPVVVRNNSISNVWIGMSIGGGATTTIEARDNNLTGGAYAINRVNTVTEVVATRNDFTGFARSIRGTNASTGSYRCNWWGSTLGPVAPETQIPGAMYAPWAMQPVAGNSSPCDPTPLQTVLVCSAPSATVFTVPFASQAMSIVASGGTVLFCDGTHTVTVLNVNKSVTLAAQGPGMPTIDAQGTFTAFYLTALGSHVTVRGLRLRNASWHNIHVAGASVVRVEGVEVHPPQSVPYNPDRFQGANGQRAGVVVFGKLTTLEVENSTFLGGDAGIHLSTTGPEPHSVLVRDNTFRGQTNAGLFVGASPQGLTLRAENNAFSECGRHGCSRAFTGGSNGGAMLTYTGNTFAVDIARPVWSVMIMNLGPTGVATARNNRIIGTGTGTGTRFDGSNYPIDGQAFQYSGHVTLEGNVVENAFAVATSVGPAILNGSNNTVSRISQMLNSGLQTPSTSVIWRRNDASDVMQILPFPQFFASHFLECNWWGSAGGPTPAMAGPLPPSSYTPFATQPIANQPAVACAP